MRYARHFSAKETPQSEPIPGAGQVANSGGGYSWAITPEQQLERFLILGSEGGSYYASERALTLKNAQTIFDLLNGGEAAGLAAIRKTVEISKAGRAPKNDPAIFVLAMAAASKLPVVRRAALNALPEVARIGTHLFTFLEAVQHFRGWGRGLRSAVGRWYTEMPADRLALQLVKYRQRDGWTHRDALRLAKPAAGDSGLLRFATGKSKTFDVVPQLITYYQLAQAATSAKSIVSIIEQCPELPWEAIPSDHLKSPDVWAALLPNMPLTAMIRNLGRMTANGLLKPLSEAARTVVCKLEDGEALRRARVHPIAVLAALLTYQQGHGTKGNLSWQPVSTIVSALNEAFYASFGNVAPANKATLLALDVSGSMSGGEVAGVPGLTPRIASAAMALLTAATEKKHGFVAFTSSRGRDGYGRWANSENGITTLSISQRQRLDDVVRTVSGLDFGGTDCALPMLWALKNGIEVETFVIYTDSETWAGKIHPKQALDMYRQASGVPARLVVVGMVSNGFTIADPNDVGMLDVVGFDTATPNLISQFSTQEVKKC